MQVRSSSARPIALAEQRDACTSSRGTSLPRVSTFHHLYSFHQPYPQLCDAHTLFLAPEQPMAAASETRMPRPNAFLSFFWRRMRTVRSTPQWLLTACKRCQSEKSACASASAKGCSTSCGRPASRCGLAGATAADSLFRKQRTSLCFPPSICWRRLTGCRSLPRPARYRISTSHNLESHASDGLRANAESAAECLDLRLGGQCHWQFSHLALQDKQRTMTLRTLVSQGDPSRWERLQQNCSSHSHVEIDCCSPAVGASDHPQLNKERVQVQGTSRQPCCPEIQM